MFAITRSIFFWERFTKTQWKKSNNVCETLRNESKRGWNTNQTLAPKFCEGSISGIPTKLA
jgi:hypothetical protein